MDDAVKVDAIVRASPRERLSSFADALAVAVAVSLPWSTSATGILVVLWLVALVPTLDGPTLRRELKTPAGGLPVALWALAALGMLWSEATWGQRLEGMAGYHKLLVIPLLLAQFRRSEHGWRVAAGYLASVVALLALSWILAIWPDLPWRWASSRGVPVKDYITQSGEFVACAFVLLYLAGELTKSGRRMLAALSIALALAMFASVIYVATGRTALVVIPVLAVAFGLTRAGWKGGLAMTLAGIVVAGVAWMSSDYLRQRVLLVGAELDKYRVGDIESSGGQRLAYWNRSLDLIAQTPVIGHGTEPITEIFRRSAKGEGGVDAVITANPHNQILAVAIHLGIVGAATLAAMWIAHLMLFGGGGAVGWFGLVIVVQNIVSSLFNSHLFDFTQGWTYVFGVGVLGGLALRGARSPPGLAGKPPP